MIDAAAPSGASSQQPQGAQGHGIPELGASAVQIAIRSRHSDRSESLRLVQQMTEEALKRTGRGLDLGQADLSGCDLSGFDLRHANLNRASLFGADLSHADLSGASLVCAGLERTNFTEARLHGAYIHALAAQASDFTRADLTGLVDATGALFHGCVMAGARLGGSELAGTTFYQCNLVDADAAGADLHGAAFNECRMDGIQLARAQLDDASITKSSIRGGVLDEARGDGLVLQRLTAADGLSLRHAYLPGLRLLNVRAREVQAQGLCAAGIDVRDCHLAGIEFSDADLRGGRFTRVSMDDGLLAGAQLQDVLWLRVTAHGLKAPAAKAESFTATECSLPEAALTGFSGRYVTFRNCDLTGADLRKAYLYRATIMGDPPASARLAGAVLDGANLTQAYVAADLTGASFRNGWATYARINQSILDCADLRGTTLYRVSAVKTGFTGAHLGGQNGAIFADRCTGLLEALHASDDPKALEIAAMVEELGGLLGRDKGKST